MYPRRASRREFLGWSAALASSAAFPSGATARPRDVESIVRWVVTTPRDPALRRAARELHAGLDPSALLGAILVAAARDIAPDRPSFNHAALVVSSIDQLSVASPSSERHRDVLWCLDNFKETQENEAQSDDWRMPPVESAKLPEGARARAALVDALERWDPEAANVAAAGFVRSAPLDEVYSLVWEYGLRCVASIGHKGIYAALSRRALPLAGESFAEDVVRSVVSAFVPAGGGRKADAFERSREIVDHGIVARSPREASDPGPGRELLAAIRQTSPDELPAVVARLVGEGAATSSLWDAVVAAAAEISVADPTVAPLHASTSVNSLHHIARHAPSERIALLALLQAAAWMAQFRTGLHGEAAAFRIDTVEGAPATFDEILAADSRGTPTVRGALWLSARDPEGFLESAHRLALGKADDVHEFKLAAAALEEARIAGAWVRPYVCAALALHLPAPAREDSIRVQRLRDAMEIASAH
jgi:hypothetical protein